VPGATKGNTLQAARVKLRGGDGQSTEDICDLERSHVQITWFGLRRQT